MITILQYLQGSGLGGPTDHVLDIIKYSDRSNIQFVYADKHHDERTDAEFEALGVPHIVVSNEKEDIKKIFRSFHVDVVHGHPGANTGCAAIDAGLEKGIPCVATIATRGPVHWDYRNEVWVVSPCQMQADYHHNIPEDRHRLIYYSVDVDRLQCSDKRAAKEHWGLDPDKPVVGWIGRFIVWKGPGAFIGIAKYTQEVNPEVQFIMFGDKDGYEPAKDLAKEIGANVLLPGGIRRKDLAYGAMDIGCFLTWGFFEGFGRVGAEIMGAGVPMIGSLCATNLELGGPYAIYLVPPQYWEDRWDAEYHGKMWAYTILALLENNPLREYMGEKGQARVRELFDARVMAQKYNKLYGEIMDGTN